MLSRRLAWVAVLVLAGACGSEGSSGPAGGGADIQAADGGDVDAHSGTLDALGDGASPGDAPASPPAPEIVQGDVAKPDVPIDAGPGCQTDDDCLAVLGAVGPCAEAVCDPVTGSCAKEPLPDGTACDDGDACTEQTVCDGGLCDSLGGTAVSCDDGDPCTADTCAPANGCAHAVTDGPCDDGSECTLGDVCKSGICKGKPAKCDDGDPCTADACDAVLGCTTSPLTGPCDDGDACTVGDVCDAGVCKAGEQVCPPCTSSAECEQDADLCNGVTACIGGHCMPDPATVVVCDTTNDTDCATTHCIPSTGICKTDTIPEGGVCDDGNGCTQGETCKGGKCKGGTKTCEPGCDPTSEPGCAGCACEACVCEVDAFCCDVEWDASCTALCTEDCGYDCSGEPPPAAGCHEAFTPGCGGCACEDCVCAMDSYCCNTAWDGLCVSECAGCGTNCSACEPACEGLECGDDGCDGSCGVCGADEACYGGLCEVHCGNGNCETALGESCGSCPGDCGACEPSSGCAVLDQGSCGGCLCEPCVCATDPFCCSIGWDGACVSLCLIDCGGCYEHEGCEPREEAGCGGCACEECVCDLDPTCCDVAWDDACVASCQLDCGESCGLEICTIDLECVDGDPCTVDTCPEPGKLCKHEETLECCSPKAGCDDGDPCTIDLCEPGGCSAVGHCCTDAAECDDGDPCSADACVQGACASTWTDDAACCQKGALFSADFEGELPFVIESQSPLGGLTVTSTQASSGKLSLWYGSDLTGDFNFGGGESTATTAAFWLPPSYGLELTFDLILDVDGDGELAVEVLADGEATVVWDTSEIWSTADWTPVKVSLGALGGRKVQLRFTVTATEFGWHQGQGVFIDDIVVATDCYFPYCGDGTCFGELENCYTCPADCATPADCPQTDGCTSWEYPSCSGCACEACVCDLDPTCCTVAWDESCATSCSADCGQACTNEGCTAKGTPGCAGCVCETCVCEMDAYCCTNAWDSLCVGECQNECGATCPPEPGNTCKGSCDGISQDETCWCDEACVLNGDCCEDVCWECGYCE